MAHALLFEESTSLERLAVRQEAFAHQIGVALLPSLKALKHHGILRVLLQGKGLQEICSKGAIKKGRLAVVFRALASAGWLNNWRPGVFKESAGALDELELTRKGKKILSLMEQHPNGVDLVDNLLQVSLELPGYIFSGTAVSKAVGDLQALRDLCLQDWAIPSSGEADDPERTCLVDYLNGFLAAPILIHLVKSQTLRTKGEGRQSLVVPWFCWPSTLEEKHLKDVQDFIYPLFRHLGWGESSGGEEQLTKKGRLAVFFASAYVVTLSYAPLFLKSEELLFGEQRFDTLFPRVEGAESHLDRPLNIWGSGAAHEMYFKQVYGALQEIFSRPDYPLAVCDTGCGNGEFLCHIFDILKQGMRWDFSDKPVYFIGSDLNKECREQTTETLKKAGVPNAYVLPGDIDINFPGKLAAAIEKLHLPVRDPTTDRPRRLSAADALHTNSMLIHNRRYLPPETRPDEWPSSMSDALYSDNAGRAIPPKELQENLVEFMRRWKPMVERYGWLFIELHTVAAKTIAENPHRTPTIAYDLTHGFTSQYPVERDELLAAAEKAGLRLGAEKLQATFPSDKFVRVSMTYLRG